jgi:hypothetical protein
MASRWLAVAVALVGMAGSAFAGDMDADATRANAYDDAWEAGPDGWVARARSLHASFKGTPGFVVHLGDSITYSYSEDFSSNGHYAAWPCRGVGKTPADAAICAYTHAADSPAETGSNASVNGWYLASRPFRLPKLDRSFTARNGMDTGRFLAGWPPMPTIDQMFTAGQTNPDGRQYRDAEMCVIMLGTNDIYLSNVTDFRKHLNTIIDKIQANGTIVVLTTLSPFRKRMDGVDAFNKAIYDVARTRGLPLIDYYAEIVRRRPDDWDGSLISPDGVHPSSFAVLPDGRRYESTSDPYQRGGEPLSHVGYLLRSWLTVQKIGEIKDKVIDAGKAAR